GRRRQGRRWCGGQRRGERGHRGCHGRRQAERRQEQSLLLLDQRLHGALGGVLPIEELAVQGGGLVLHLLHGGQAVARQVAGLGGGGGVGRRGRRGGGRFAGGLVSVHGRVRLPVGGGGRRGHSRELGGGSGPRCGPYGPGRGGGGRVRGADRRDEGRSVYRVAP